MNTPLIDSLYGGCGMSEGHLKAARALPASLSNRARERPMIRIICTQLTALKRGPSLVALSIVATLVCVNEKGKV
ncbi:ATP-dependent (S)-NAD(P)H-hydrate dehydratase isoform X3 [Scomber scombrus]|uniref:ATP-dependent (S)-NAD(P)H-hydrate dehydratase isoform X3 n=1 Tax=Scomber scombrus TaxID=13677 RepID=A0AAV1NJG1_SCOSC